MLLELYHAMVAVRLRLVESKLEALRKQIRATDVGEDTMRDIRRLERYSDKSILLRSTALKLKRRIRERKSYLIF